MMYPEILALMGAEVIVREEVATDAYGDRTYIERNNSPYKCYAVNENARVWSMEGREDTTSLTLYMASEDVQAKDQFEYDGIIFKCKSLQTWRDETNEIVGQVAYLQ